MVIYLILAVVMWALAFAAGNSFGAGPCANDIILAEKAREAREAAAKAMKESERVREDSRIRGFFYEEYQKTAPGKVLGYGDEEVLADLILAQRPKTAARLAKKQKAEQKVRELDSAARVREIATTTSEYFTGYPSYTIYGSVGGSQTFTVKEASHARKSKKRA